MVISKFLAGFSSPTSSSSCHIARKCFSHHNIISVASSFKFARPKMRYPVQSKRKGAGYESLSNALSEFEGNQTMPLNVPEFLTKDAKLKQTLMINYAKFH